MTQQLPPFYSLHQIATLMRTRVPDSQITRCVFMHYLVLFCPLPAPTNSDTPLATQDRIEAFFTIRINILTY